MTCHFIMAANGGRAQDPLAEARALVAAARAHLEWLAQTGVEDLVVDHRKRMKSAGRTKDPGPGAGAESVSPVDPARGGVRAKAAASSGNLFTEPVVAEAETLADLDAALAGCQRCKLAGGRTNIVFGVGNPAAEILFVGEGPGEEEDLRAEPFVGRAGRLLTRIITNGMKLRREDVYIANIVKCRPERNRTPQPDEIAACIPFLERQVEMIKPRVVVALGAVAVQALLGTPVAISRIRGCWQEYRGIALMPTFHPAYLLRNPSQKQAVWEDIRKVMNKVGIKR